MIPSEAGASVDAGGFSVLGEEELQPVITNNKTAGNTPRYFIKTVSLSADMYDRCFGTNAAERELF
jgi:hypothetical protein